MWPDIWPAFVVFRAASTQWRVSINGITGLDYNVLPWLMKVYATEDEVTAINDIQIMEAAVLNIFRQSQSVSH